MAGGGGVKEHGRASHRGGRTNVSRATLPTISSMSECKHPFNLGAVTLGEGISCKCFHQLSNISLSKILMLVFQVESTELSRASLLNRSKKVFMPEAALDFGM